MSTNHQERFDSIPFIVHVPHASTEIPEDLRSELLLDDQALMRELMAMTDHFTDRIAAMAVGMQTVIRFPVSRLVVDPERFTEDAVEVMAARGMGVIYTQTSEGLPLRTPPTEVHRQALLNRYYHPHHERLADAVECIVATLGQAILLDLHSFPSRPLPYELDQRTYRPDICFGTDSYHTPTELLEVATATATAAGYSTSINAPFAGTLVPSRHYKRNRAVKSLMIELRRDLYMNEQNAEPHSGLDRNDRICPHAGECSFWNRRDE